MLYDKHRSAPVQMTCDDITVDDLRDFCKVMEVEFVALGCPEGCGGTGWDDPSVFRAATLNFPQVGVTIPLARVLEWKCANQAIGERVFEGGVYLHYRGGRVTTVGQARQEGDNVPVVVYKGESGLLGTCPTETFFSVVHYNGRLLPRYALERPEASLKPIPRLGVRMTAAEYQEAWLARDLLPTEGKGYWATETQMSQVTALAAQPYWATHVVWFHY